MSLIRNTENLITKINSLEPRYLLEFLALKEDVKKVLRIHIENPKEYDLLKIYAKEMGFLVDHSTFKLKVSWQNELGDTFLENTHWNNPDAEQFVAYLSQDQKFLDQAISIEVDGDHLDAGLLYGYPKCCCENYKTISEGKYWIDCLLENSSGLVYDHRTNKLAYLTNGYTLFPDYFNCSLHCKGTIELSDKYGALGDVYGLSELISHISSCMKGLFLVQSTNIIKFDTYKIDSTKNLIEVSTKNRWMYGAQYDFLNGEVLKLSIEEIDDGFYASFKDLKYRILVFE